jgi:hypothetical protein
MGMGGMSMGGIGMGRDPGADGGHNRSRSGRDLLSKTTTVDEADGVFFNVDLD